MDLEQEIKDSLIIKESELPNPPKTEPAKEETKVYKRSPKKDDDPNAILGRIINDEVSSVRDIIGEVDNVTIEGYVFGDELFKSNKSDFKIIIKVGKN